MSDVKNNVFVKDPNAKLDYQWDWTDWLQVGESISTATVTVPSGLTLESQSNTTQKVTAWISGGTARVRYRVVCRITTNAAIPRIDDRSIYIRCDER